MLIQILSTPPDILEVRGSVDVVRLCGFSVPLESVGKGRASAVAVTLLLCQRRLLTVIRKVILLRSGLLATPYSPGNECKSTNDNRTSYTTNDAANGLLCAAGKARAPSAAITTEARARGDSSNAGRDLLHFV